MKRTLLSIFTACCLLLGVPAKTQTIKPNTKEDVGDQLGKKSYSPYANRNFPTRVFWGDTHLHTNASIDAGYQHSVASIMSVRAMDTGQRQVYDAAKREIIAG